MKISIPRLIRFFAAGSLAATAMILAFIPFNMGGCSVNGIDVGAIAGGAGKLVQATSLSEKDEISIGQSVAVQATNRWKIYPDEKLNRYVTLVARTVGQSSPETKLKLFCAVLDTDEVNAFSGPHGYIFVTRGAIAKMHDESELAGVLGHEIGHIVKQHGLNAVKTEGQKQGLMEMASGANAHFAHFDKLADIGGEAIINTGFSQPQEEEADSEGVKYVVAAGYDPDGFLHFLQRIAKEQGAGGKPFGTHPGAGARVKLVSDEINKLGAAGQGATLADRFHLFVTFH
jgi:predicted Zn-dependent protease